MPKHPDHGPRIYRNLGGELAPGATVASGATVGVLVPIFGYEEVRIRLKTTSGAGTLKATFIRPDGDGAFPDDGTHRHTTGNPADVSVSAATEAMMEVSDLRGEAYLLVEYVDDGVTGPGTTLDYVTFGGR